MSRNYFYDADTDSLFLRINTGKYEASREVSPGVVVDFDVHGQPIALDIENASELIRQTLKSRVRRAAVRLTNLPNRTRKRAMRPTAKASKATARPRAAAKHARKHDR